MERRRKEEEEERQAVLAQEKEKEGLTSCCATLRADLEEKERQANRQQEQIDAAQTKVKVRGTRDRAIEEHCFLFSCIP